MSVDSLLGKPLIIFSGSTTILRVDRHSDSGERNIDGNQLNNSNRMASSIMVCLKRGIGMDKLSDTFKKTSSNLKMGNKIVKCLPHYFFFSTKFYFIACLTILNRLIH